MKPSVTVTRKMSVEIAQKAKVCAALVGANSPKLNDTCHATSVSRSASNTSPEPNRYRFRIVLIIVGQTAHDHLVDPGPQPPGFAWGYARPALGPLPAAISAKRRGTRPAGNA